MPADLVRVVEASYDLLVPEAEWVRGLLVSIRPFMEHGLGVFGWVTDVRRPTEPRSIVTIDTHPRMDEAIRRIHEAASPDEFASGYQTKPETLSERFGRTRFADLALAKQFVHPYGARDSLGIPVFDPSGFYVTLGAPMREEGKAERSFVRRGARIARHVATALRLRRRLEAELARESAILSPEGDVCHAIDDARDTGAREALRGAVLDRERARGKMRRQEPDRALELWRGLVSGRWSVVDRFDSDGRRFLVAYENPPDVAPSRTLTPMEARVVTLVSVGFSLKLVAYELGISLGTVTSHLERALAKTGMKSRTELVRWFRASAEAR